MTKNKNLDQYTENSLYFPLFQQINVQLLKSLKCQYKQVI